MPVADLHNPNCALLRERDVSEILDAIHGDKPFPVAAVDQLLTSPSAIPEWRKARWEMWDFIEAPVPLPARAGRSCRKCHGATVPANASRCTCGAPVKPWPGRQAYRDHMAACRSVTKRQAATIRKRMVEHGMLAVVEPGKTYRLERRPSAEQQAALHAAMEAVAPRTASKEWTGYAVVDQLQRMLPIIAASCVKENMPMPAPWEALDAKVVLGRLKRRGRAFSVKHFPVA